MAYKRISPIPIVEGGTNSETVITSPTATSWAGWDSDSNFSANNYNADYQTTVTSDGTTTLTVESARYQEFTGTSNQIVTLPSTDTLTVGYSIIVTNNSRGGISVKTSTSADVFLHGYKTTIVYICKSTASNAASSWYLYSSLTSMDLSTNLITGTVGGPLFTGGGSYNCLYGGGNNVTSGNYNTMVGSGAGNSITSGSGNVAIGFGSLPQASTGSNMVAIGFLAGFFLNGDNSIAIGNNSLANCTANVTNLALGVGALQRIVDGNFNTALGTNAATNNVFTSSSNIVIGHNSATTTTSTSNQLQIGVATGTGDGELDTAYIHGINGNTVSNTMMVTIDSSTSQLGTAAVPSVNPTVSSSTTIASPLAVNSDNFGMYIATAQANDLTISADIGSPVNGQKLTFRFLDDGTPRALTWTSGSTGAYEAIGITLPTTTTANKILYVGFIYNSDAGRWDGVATVVQS